jgi:hypothetical protein
MRLSRLATRHQGLGVAQIVAAAALVVGCGRSRSVGDTGGAGAVSGDGGAGASSAGRGGAAGRGGSAGQGGLAGQGGAAGRPGSAGEGGAAECEDARAELDRSCVTDADCVVGAWNHCMIYDRTELLGLAAGALDDLAALAERCGRPVEAADCPGEGGGISPAITEDGLEPWRHELTAAAACVDNRCTSYSTRCGRDLCGNGSVDECRVTPGAQPTFEQQFDYPAGAREECDGDAFGPRSCQTLGYAGGNLRCGEDSCIVDASECVVCSEAPGPLVDCRVVEAEPVSWFDLAASESELAVLSLRGAELRLARFAADLSPLGEVVIPPPELPIGWGEGALARANGAWVAIVTRSNPAGYSLYTLRDGGELEEHARTSGGEYRDPFLVARPGGSPLFVYGVPSLEGFVSTQALLVADDLESFGSGQGIASSPVKSGAWAGDGYLVGTVVEGQAALLRLDAELAAAPERVSLMTFSGVSELLLGSDEQTVFVLHHAPGTDSWLVPVDAAGMPVDAGLGFGVLASPGLPVPIGGGALVPTAFTPNGAPSSVVRVVGGTPNQFIQSEAIASPAEAPQAVRLGDELIVAFKSERGFGLARYEP